MKRYTAAAIAALVLVMGMAPTAEAGRLRGYISKLYARLSGGGVARVFIHDVNGGFCGAAEISGITSGGGKVAYEAALSSLMAQAPGSLQHWTVWYTSSPSGACPGSVGPVTSWFFYHR